MSKINNIPIVSMSGIPEDEIWIGVDPALGPSRTIILPVLSGEGRIRVAEMDPILNINMKIFGPQSSIIMKGPISQKRIDIMIKLGIIESKDDLIIE